MKLYSKLLGIFSLLTAIVALTIICYLFFNNNLNKSIFILGLLGIFFIVFFIIINRFGFKEIDITTKSINGLLYTSSILFILLSFVVIKKILQENNRKSQIEILSKMKDFGKDENITTGTFGSLKTKYENDKLYYQVILDIPKTQIDSFSDFSIQFYDNDGFVITDFSLFSSKNIGSTDKGNILQFSINDNMKFEVQNYEKIAKWELLRNIE